MIAVEEAIIEILVSQGVAVVGAAIGIKVINRHLKNTLEFVD